MDYQAIVRLMDWSTLTALTVSADFPSLKPLSMTKSSADWLSCWQVDQGDETVSTGYYHYGRRPTTLRAIAASHLHLGSSFTPHLGLGYLVPSGRPS